MYVYEKYAWQNCNIYKLLYVVSIRIRLFKGSQINESG